MNGILLRIKCVHYCIKMEFRKIVNFLDVTSDVNIFQNLLLKTGLKSMINQKEIIAQAKKLESKHQC